MRVYFGPFAPYRDCALGDEIPLCRLIPCEKSQGSCLTSSSPKAFLSIRGCSRREPVPSTEPLSQGMKFSKGVRLCYIPIRESLPSEILYLRFL